MEKQIQYVGIDVDDKSFHICAIHAESGELVEFQCKPNVGALKKKLESLQKHGERLKICYEAGYLGFSLCRDLRKSGYECEVIAPSLTPEKKGDPVKTDRLDAQKLADYFMKDLLTIVHVPEEEEEATRDLIRSRSFLKKKLSSMKSHVISLCRRLGVDYKQTKGEKASYWTGIHQTWLKAQVENLPVDAHRLNFKFLLNLIDQVNETVKLYDQEIERLSKTEPYAEAVQALRSFRSIETLSAMVITSELGDIKRFSHPEKLTSYVGFDLREYSSGGKEKKFGISRLGNKYLRTTLTEAAQRAKYPPALSKKLKERRKQASAKSIEIADRCMLRLYQKSKHLLDRGKHPNQVKTAAAREMLSFMWEALRAAA